MVDMAGVFGFLGIGILVGLLLVLFEYCTAAYRDSKTERQLEKGKTVSLNYVEPILCF